MEDTYLNNQENASVVSLERDRAVRLFRFLRAYVEERTQKVRKIDSYEDVLWLSDIPKEPDCECSAWYFEGGSNEQDFWIKVHKPKFKLPPSLPKELEPWTNIRDVENSSLEMPELKTTITKEFKNASGELETEILAISNFPNIKQLWEEYVQEKWWPWAEEDRRLKKVQEVYKELFSFKEKQQKLGETYEVVIGIGYLTWKTPTTQEVARHILTAQTSISFDSKRGIITIGPAGGGSNLTLEQDMLETTEQPNPLELSSIDNLVTGASDAIWDNILIEPILKSWVNSISYQGQYENKIERQSSCTTIPTVRFAPALILRKRNEKSYIKLFKEIEQQLLEDAGEIPHGILSLVAGSGIELPQANNNHEHSSSAIIDEDTYFPLPYNREQQEIVRKLSSNKGIVVQGPPGTGKSHTIANLICHLLAQGKRILITSQTKRALEVLHLKLPEQIRPLCVSVLGDDQIALEGLKNSVEGINIRHSNWNQDRNLEAIKQYTHALEEARRDETLILSQLREIREKETFKFTDISRFYQGTLAKIAQKLKEDSSYYSWLRGLINTDKPCPLSNSEAIDLLELLKALPLEKQNELKKAMILLDDLPLEDLPNASEFKTMVQQKSNAALKVSETQAYHSHPSYDILKKTPDGTRKGFLDSLNILYVAINEILNHRQKFTQKLVEDMLADHDRWWKRLYDITKTKIEELDGKASQYANIRITGIEGKDYLVVRNDALNLSNYLDKTLHKQASDQNRGWKRLFDISRPKIEALELKAIQLSGMRVVGLEGRDYLAVKSHAQALLNHLESGKGLGFWDKSFNRTVKEARYIYEDIRINSAPCNNQYALTQLIEWLDLTQELSSLEAYWSEFISLPMGNFSQKIEKYKAYLEPLGETKYLYETVRVNGALCDNLHTLTQLTEWIDLNLEFDSLQTHWAELTTPPTGSFVQKLEEYRDFIEPIEYALTLYKCVQDAKEKIDEIAGLNHPVWHRPKEVKELMDVIQAIEFEIADENSRATLIALENKISEVKHWPNIHPIINDLEESAKTRDVEKYCSVLNSIESLAKECDLLDGLNNLKEDLETSSPLVINEIRNSIDDPVWESRLKCFEEAWDWVQTDARIQKLSDDNESDRLRRALDVQKQKREKALCNLVEVKAWRHCLEKMTEPQRKRLVAWKQAVKNIGKGTGKYAEKYRREAREHMGVCREAIPAWIMPLYRVAETISPQKEAFDVCIVDEASQSGPEALFLFYIAKKIIVVGDDQQIAPEFIGLSHENIDRLRENYIRDLELKDTFGLNRSFFDHSAIHFGGKIPLREHFRCMPEIIQFSNNLCYSHEPLEPVRQFGADRLDPIVVRQVKSGYIKSKGTGAINESEADAIVEQIAACCADPTYLDKKTGKPKTMGVIVLLSSGKQAKLIETKLLDRIGAEEIEKRKIICGDAYDFQGDERDVIFLSMVSAPTDQNGQMNRIGPLAKEQDMRRFNVAASRARDQLWLFHSCTENDLSQSCYRYRLLQYCRSPKVERTEFDGKSVTTDVLIDPFHSLFEQRVFLKISQRGYRIVPQYEIAGYSVDLMIYGMNGRLGVECDGDHWHGPERYEHDMGRQRDLERYGLRFWRIRESSFNRDPEGALESLWQALEGFGIFPEGSYQEQVQQEEEIKDILEDLSTEQNSEEDEEDDLDDDEDSAVEILEIDTSIDDDLLHVLDDDTEKHPTEFSLEELEEAIITVLKGCPNYTCVKGELFSPKQSDLTAKVCKFLGIRTRGNPRKELTQKIFKAVNNLVRRNIIKEYQAKSVGSNVRLKLISFD